MKIVILGQGHMGSWLSRRLSATHETAVYDIKGAVQDGDSRVLALADISEISSFGPDLLINAVSLQHTLTAFEKVLPFLPRNCTLSDVASIKGDIGDFYRNSGFSFASVHPMFGPTFADMDTLIGESVIIIKESCQAGIDFMRTFFQKLGTNIFEYTFEEHDKMMAYSLSVPFISTFTFAGHVNRNAVPGTTFAKHMKIAKGLLAEDDHLLGEVLFNTYSLPELEKVTARLEYLKHIIRARDMEELSAFLNRLRKNIL